MMKRKQIKYNKRGVIIIYNIDDDWGDIYIIHNIIYNNNIINSI